MARAIDADKAMEIAQIKYNDWNLAMTAADGQREINLCFKKQELFKAVKAVLECVPTLTQPNEWVSVEERLPEPDFPGQQRGFYLVALSNRTVKELMYEFRHYENMMFDVGWHETAYPVTHWMPLPAPPDRRPPEGEEDT